MTEGLLPADTTLSAGVNRAALAITNRENTRPLPALYAYWADTPNSSGPPQYFNSGQAATSVVQTSGGWCVNNGTLTLQTPLPGGGTVGYLTANVGGLATRVGGRFSFSSTDPNGVACISICNGIVNPAANMPNMSVHLHVSPFTWTFGVWQGTAAGGGGETVLGSGSFTFVSGMDPGTGYEMECWINGTTATVRLPDGSIQTFTDSRIGTYGGNWVFLESYTTGSTNSIPSWTHFWADTGTQVVGSPAFARTVDAVFGGTTVFNNIKVTGNEGGYGPAAGSLAYSFDSAGNLGWIPLIWGVPGVTSIMESSKTSAYTAAYGDFVPCSASGGAFTVTLPTPPASGVRIVVMKTDSSTNAVTVATSGSDVINVSGTTSIKLVSQFAVAFLQYNSGIWYNQEAPAPCKFTWLVQSGTRATGYGDMPEGIYFDQAATIFAVQFRAGTADASGSNTVALYSNTTNAATGSAISSGSTTLTATSAGGKTTLTGPWSIAAGTYLQVNVTAVGTTPGSRLYCDVYGVYL